MTYAGAAGATAAEMEKVLHLGTEPGIHASFAALLSSFDEPMGVSVIEEKSAAVPNASGMPISLSSCSSLVVTVVWNFGTTSPPPNAT